MDKNELFPLFRTIIKDFNLKGELTDISCISTGNINDTYVARTAFHLGEKLYIIQRVNHNVFSSPEKIAENVSQVTNHIEQKLRAENASDIRRRVLRYYRKNDGSYYHITESGDYWRVVSCVYGAVSVNDADLVYLRAAGEAFGEFQRYLSDFPADTLYETIPDFHNTKKRYETLRKAAELNKANRLDEVREEYEYLLRQGT